MIARSDKFAVSLRGSLATEAARAMASSSNPERAAEQYVRTILASRDPDLIRVAEEDLLVIGRRSERGCYPPDW
jgi:hypothetical protein